MLQASLPECSQEAYRGITGRATSWLSTAIYSCAQLQKTHYTVSQLSFSGLWEGN